MYLSIRRLRGYFQPRQQKFFSKNIGQALKETREREMFKGVYAIAVLVTPSGFQARVGDHFFFLDQFILPPCHLPQSGCSANARISPHPSSSNILIGNTCVFFFPDIHNARELQHTLHTRVHRSCCFKTSLVFSYARKKKQIN